MVGAESIPLILFGSTVVIWQEPTSFRPEIYIETPEGPFLLNSANYMVEDSNENPNQASFDSAGWRFVEPGCGIGPATRTARSR